MKTHRPQRAESLIHMELSKLIAKEMDFPLGAFVTVSGVLVSEDMAHAKVGISIIPKEMEKNVMIILKKSQGYLQYLLNKKINIIPMPRIELKADHGAEKAAKVENLLLNK